MVSAPKTARLIKKMREEFPGSIQEELAPRLKVQRDYLSKLESGTQNLTVEKLLAGLEWFKKTKAKKDYKDFILRLFS